MHYCTRVILTDYRTDDTCATVHVRHATTDPNTRALPTRGHARPHVHRADRRIANFCAHRSLCYSTRARWPHVGAPAHVCTVYGRSGLNLRARAGRYTTLTNAPATIQRAVDILLSPFRWKSCSVYLDDIIIFSKSWKKHIVHVDEILSVLEKTGVKLKLRKCEMFVEKIEYLGHVVRPGTSEVDAARTAALEQVRYPQTQTQLRSLLGWYTNVYHRFVPHYAKSRIRYINYWRKDNRSI